MKNVITAIILLAIAGAGWFLYSQNGRSALQDTNEDTSLVLSASVNCADGTHFIAEFPAGQVQIVVDGTLVRTLPKVEGAGQRYEDSAFVYVFAGEEVTVTDKTSGKTTTCTQPVDANNAPVNFGDAGEGGGVKQDTTLIVSESIVAKWKSADDTKFTREFKSGGVVVDMYDNKAATNGTWVVFTKANPLQVSFPMESDVVYVQLKMSGSQAETLNFKLGKLTPEELELVYMDRGNTLRFTRVQ